MYKQFNIVELMKQGSIEKCLEDRKQYTPFLDCAKQFAIENHMTILNIPKQSELDLFTYNFYTFNASKMSRLLAMKLFSISPLGRYTKVITKVRDYIYVINVNERELCTITDIPNYKGVRITDLVGNVFVNDMLYIGDEIQSIVIYKKLCNPAEEKDWKFLHKCIGDIIGGSECDTNADDADMRDDTPMTKIKLYEEICKIASVKSEYPSVIIGSAALSLRNGKREIEKENRLQIITTCNLSVFQKMFKQSNVTTSVANLQLFVDIRLARLTVYINKEPLVDIFNAGIYELLPYVVVGNLCVGSKYLLLCYRLIDIWTMQILLAMKIIKQQYFNTITGIFKKQYEEMKKLKLEENCLYMGKIVNYELYVKRTNTEINYPFYPLTKFKKHN